MPNYRLLFCIQNNGQAGKDHSQIKLLKKFSYSYLHFKRTKTKKSKSKSKLIKGEEKRHIKKGRVGRRSVLTIRLGVFNNHDHARDLIYLKSPTCHVLENF